MGIKMNFSFDINVYGQKTNWDIETVENKLENVRDAKKTDSWITATLETKDNWRITQCIWKFIAKHFECLRYYLFGVDLVESKKVLTQIHDILDKTGEDDNKLKTLFYDAVSNFNQIVKNPDHQINTLFNIPIVKKENKSEEKKVEEKKVEEKTLDIKSIPMKIEAYNGKEKKSEVKDTGIDIGDFKPKKRERSVQDQMKKNLALAHDDQIKEDQVNCPDQLLEKGNITLKKIFEKKFYGCVSESIKIEEKIVGSFSAKGRRSGVNEDRHLATELNIEIQGKMYSFELCGVFDGHGGEEVAEFVKQHLASVLTKTLKYHNKEGFTEEGFYIAIKHACRALDEAVKKDDNLSSQGSTVVFSLCIGNKIYHACVGDARIAVLTKDSIKLVTQDAKVENERYAKKIKANGGKITSEETPIGLIYKVYTDEKKLAVARAIGDWHMGQKDGKPAISAEPKITCTNLDDIEGPVYLIHTCDGTWAHRIEYNAKDKALKVLPELTLNPKTLHKHVNILLEKGYSMEEIAKSIGCGAINEGSNDNITFLIEQIK